jgi:hypothetical protein
MQAQIIRLFIVVLSRCSVRHAASVLRFWLQTFANSVPVCSGQVRISARGSRLNRRATIDQPLREAAVTTRTFDDLPDGEQTEFLDRSTSLQDLSEFTRRLNALSWVSAASMSRQALPSS